MIEKYKNDSDHFFWSAIPSQLSPREAGRLQSVEERLGEPFVKTDTSPHLFDLRRAESFDDILLLLQDVNSFQIGF